MWLAGSRGLSSNNRLRTVPTYSLQKPNLRLSAANFVPSKMPLEPKVIEVTPLDTDQAKWIGLKKIHYIDQDGKKRVWESAERRTRGASGVDAVAILAILRSKTNAFPLSTVVIEQYRPAVDKFVIELPAGLWRIPAILESPEHLLCPTGLIDKNETAEQAAVRELEEETGYKAEKVTESSPIIFSDPGRPSYGEHWSCWAMWALFAHFWAIGMSNANMKLVVASVPMNDQLEMPDSKLDVGEHIVKRVIALDKLNTTLKEYDEKVSVWSSQHEEHFLIRDRAT
ncbi:NUDIX hydrolase domain-like protein [Pisolithus orientalis]|uniref:NUDIX hydrolase domain-like protein n=1 Tax=Pisolithus orientalis TaxID=936130 RepID=UPI0022249F9E|nr:NUDIX hydrolase domain-like protein [Pisolithus orientalis]KAI6007754.1 NUDIX hydrolase domain-like protein [Pisolithus orientalis]